MVLNVKSWESIVLFTCGLMSSLCSLISIVTFFKFPFLKSEHPREMYLLYTIVDVVCGVIIAIAFFHEDSKNSCFESVMAQIAILIVFFAQSLLMLTISHTIWIELKLKKLAIDVMKDMSLSDRVPSRQTREANQNRRRLIYYCICSFVPVLYGSLVLGLNKDVCDYRDFADIPAYYILIPELTLIPTFVLCYFNTKIATVCSKLLGVGTKGVSIESKNFSIPIYFGMIVVFGLTRIPAFLTEIARLSIDDHDSDTSQGLLALYCILLPIQGMFLFFWFAYKLKYIELWKSTLGCSSNASSSSDDDDKKDSSRDVQLPVIETFSGLF